MSRGDLLIALVVCGGMCAEAWWHRDRSCKRLIESYLSSETSHPVNYWCRLEVVPRTPCLVCVPNGLSGLPR